MTDADRLVQLFAGKRLLIFDFDGTLVESSPVHAQAFAQVFEPYGVAVKYSTIAGMTTAAAVDRLIEQAGLTIGECERADLVSAKQACARNMLADGLDPLPGALAFVERAAGRFSMALCTAASRATLDVALETSGFDDRFDPIVTADDVSAGKPAPDAFLAALVYHRLAPDEALVFEDADSGIAAAKVAGIDAIRIGGQAATTGDAFSSDWYTLCGALDELAQ